VKCGVRYTDHILLQHFIIILSAKSFRNVCGQRAFEIHACVGPALMRRKQPCGCLSTTYVRSNCNKPEGLYYRMQKVYYLYTCIYRLRRENNMFVWWREFITLKGVYTSEFYLSTCSAKVWVFLLSISIVRFKLLFIREWIAQQAAWMSVFIFC